MVKKGASLTLQDVGENTQDPAGPNKFILGCITDNRQNGIQRHQKPHDRPASEWRKPSNGRVPVLDFDVVQQGEHCFTDTLWQPKLQTGTITEPGRIIYHGY
ncbi:MAG: hypothetical protein ACU83N_00300 [Gammaproteobacteria bacterium]